MEEGEDSDSQKTVRLEDYQCQPETIPIRRLTEEHGGLIQNVATAPSGYETTPIAYLPSYELAKNVTIGKQLISSRFLSSKFQGLVIDSINNDNQVNQYINSTRCDHDIKRELLDLVSDDVQDNTRYIDEEIISIHSSDEEQSDQNIDEKKHPSPLNTPVTIQNSFDIVDLEIFENDVPPPITRVNKPNIRIKVLNPKAINEQAAANLYSEVISDDKTKLNKDIVSSIRSSDGENTLCKSNNSTIYAPTSNVNFSSSSDIQTVAKNTSDKISESTNKNWKETANPREDKTRNTKLNTFDIVAKGSTAERVELVNPENSKSEKGTRDVESNRLFNMNAEETRRQANRLSGKDTLPTTCKRIRTGPEESTKNTLHSVCNNDVKVDSNTDLTNTNVLEPFTNTHQRNSQNSSIVNEQKEKETSNTQNLKELKNLNENKENLKILSRFCSFMMEHLSEKWKSLSEGTENKNAFLKSARLLADEINKLNALEKVDVQLNCPVCSRISTFTGIHSYDYYNQDTEGKQQNRFKKCYLCYSFQKKYSTMIKPFLPIQSIKSDGAKSFESNQNIHTQKGQPITQKIRTPLKYNKDTDNETTVNSLSKSEISVLHVSSKRDNGNDQDESSAESINTENILENMKHNTHLQESVNKKTDAPNNFATMENMNNISHIIGSLTLEGNISTVATNDSFGSEATSIETVHRHPVDISTPSTSKHNNNPDRLVDNTTLILSEKLDNVDKYHKVDIGKTNNPNNENGSKLISTTTSVYCPIVNTPVTEPKQIFGEIKGNAKDIAVDRDSHSDKDHASLLRLGESAVAEETNKPVIKKSTENAYDINKNLPNNNNTIDYRVDDLTTHKRNNKEMHIKPLERSFITRNSDIDLPSTLSTLKANTSRDMNVKLKDDSSGHPRLIDSEHPSVTTQKSRTNVLDVNMSKTTFDTDISNHKVDSNTTVKNLSDTVKARRKSKETCSRSVSENAIGKIPDVNLPSLSEDKKDSTYKLRIITTESSKVLSGDICLSEESSANIVAKTKNDGTNKLKTADRLGGKSTLVTSGIKQSSGTENDTISFKTSNDKGISDHRVESITAEVKSLSDTAKARPNSKEMFGRSVGLNPIRRTQSLHLQSKNKDHTNNQLSDIKANNSTPMSEDRCQSKESCVPNISKNESSSHLRRTGDELVSKGTAIKIAINQRADVSDHGIDGVHVPETTTRDNQNQNMQLSKGLHKRKGVHKLKGVHKRKLNIEDLCNALQFGQKKQKIGTSLVHPTLTKDSIGVVEERNLTKEKSLFNIHPKINNNVSNSKNSIPKEANILGLRVEDKKVSGGISVGTQDSNSSTILNSATSNNHEVSNRAVDSGRKEKRDERKDNIFTASAHPNDKNLKIHDLDRVSDTTAITAESVNSLVPKSKSNYTNLNISDVHAKTKVFPVQASKRRMSTDTSIFNIPPKIFKDQIGTTSVLSISSKPEASKESTVTSIPAELKSIESPNTPNENPRAGIFIVDEASTKKYYDDMHQRADRVVTEANHFAFEAENSNHPSSSLASVPTEAAKCHNYNPIPTAMSSREKMARLLATDGDDYYTNTCSISKTNIAIDETQTSPKRMNTNDVEFGTNDDVGNASSYKSPKNNIADAVNHALTLNEPLASVHLSCNNNSIESLVEKTKKKSFCVSSSVKHDEGHIKSYKKDNLSKMREMLLCEVKNPFLHSTDIPVSNDNQTKHITSVKDQNNKLAGNHTDEVLNNLKTNEVKDGHKPYKKSNERQKQQNKTLNETNKNINTLKNGENRGRVKNDSAKGVARNGDADSANGSVNVKENEANGLASYSQENRQEKSTIVMKAQADNFFLETSKNIIKSKIIYQCPICSCVYEDPNIYLGHLKSSHNLSIPEGPETVELNNNSNENDEAEPVNKLNNSVSITSTQVNVQQVEKVSAPFGKAKYIYKCSICNETLHTYYSARTHKKEFHPKKKHLQIYERIVVDCERGKQNHTSDDDDDNNENNEAMDNEVSDEDTIIEGHDISDNDENNEAHSNMSNNNVVIMTSDEEAIDNQSKDVEQQTISDISSSNPVKNSLEKNSQSNGKDCSTSDSKAKQSKAGVSNDNEQSFSDKVNHGHDINFSKQGNIHRSTDESDVNSVNKDSNNGNDMEVDEETREGRSEDKDEEQSHDRRNIKPNDENVMKYGYKCKICNVVCPSRYASVRHREMNHFQMRNRQLFERVSLCRRLNDQEKEKNVNSFGQSIPIVESSLQPVPKDNHENRMKEKAQTEAEDSQQKIKRINSDQEHQCRDYERNTTNGDKLHTNNHDSEKLSNAPESSSSTHNSHNLVIILSAGISHINQKGNKESSNNENQINNQFIHNSNYNIRTSTQRQVLSSTASSNFPNELISHNPSDNNVQKISKQKEDKTNNKRTVHGSETNNRQTGDEITQNQSDHKNIPTNKLPASPDAYVLSCLECGYTTEICDSVIRHCQNHYNDVKDPTTYCTMCQLNFDTDNFKSHQNLHGKYIGFEVVKYSYKSLFSNWDKIFVDIPMDVVKDFRKKSIYKTNCIKMVVTENGPWEDSLYLCGECGTCVPSQEIEQHFQQNCYFVSYLCAICKRYFTSLEMLVEHEKNHSKSYRVVAFNNNKDKIFNCKLLEARKNQQDLMNEKVPATIYKCACELCFATSNSFKIHFIDCDFTTKHGVLCNKCTVPRHFQSTELENHLELHHSATTYKLLVRRVTINEEKVPDENCE